MALSGSLPSTFYKFDSYTSIAIVKHKDSSRFGDFEENSKDGKYLLVNDQTYVFCYRETFEPGNVFLPIPIYVSMNDIFKPSLYMSLMQRVSAHDKVDIPEAVFNVLTLTGRRLVVCDDPGLFKIAEKVQLRLTSPHDDHTEDSVLEEETVQLKIPTAATEKNLLMFPLELSSGQEQTFRKNQFLTIISSDLVKHGLQFWTDMRSFRPDPVIDSDTIGKYHPFPRSKLDFFFMPKYCESVNKRPGGSRPRQFGSGVLFCETSCRHSDIKCAMIQSADCPNLLNRAMKEAFIIGAEVATYALTHHKRFAKLDIEVYLLIVSMIVDEAQILNMKLELGDVGSNYMPVYRLSSTTTRHAAFNDLMNFLKRIKML